jgi:serine/threonine protein kinase/formylglycine-generating enzyme required for sulfatase activity
MLPERISRYVVKKVLGKGGFGVVYLAHDEQLCRFVAVKVPHPELVKRAEDAESHLAEARTVAGLDHPNIVTVFDVGGTPEFPFFVVSKYIEGSDLAQRLKESRPSIREAVELAATVAETLHYAHRQGLVHRDIKPGNILLDKSGKPYVADFGLALKEENVGQGPRLAGTPAYMSPEQARSEGHRVDGRSDIFSLGIVFYEMLTGRRPFSGKTYVEVLEQITMSEARPLRQWDDAIPKELERICLKALAKRAVDRYLTASDMADDLRSFLEQATSEEMYILRSGVPLGGSSRPSFGSTPIPSSLPTPGSDSQPLKIVPKGLRSFDARDADFFLELLPGPRDRAGLPDSIRFWKTRIETTEADNTFAVGLIYGPSGCGKSSLVKAGLLPRLATHVAAVYVESSAEDTEERLLKGLQRALPGLPSNLGLTDALTALRQGRYLKPEQKVLVVLDQFEQWLHAKRGEDNTELVQALRHCDGGRLQSVVMVRDDFWLAVSRFMQALEIVPDGDNSRLVDLFDLRHARKVLMAFGRAFEALPENQLSKDQEAFLDQAVAGLAQDGKVISVRLALFAEMVKGKPWTPATLKEVGGIEGVGVTFLEETFAASTAPPQHRLHHKAAQAVLKALLPESGTDIKGHMRSRHELLSASGYGSGPKDFDDVLRILDTEIRLITPTDPEGRDNAETSTLQSGVKYYQLTHDYLVPSLRDWLTRKQKETRRGRAKLLLADRAAVWNARPENRQLPSLLQSLQVRWLTESKQWTLPQRKMMAKAGRVHGTRAIIAVLLLALVGWGAYEGHGRLQAHAFQGRLLDADITDIKAIVEDMAPYRRWLDPLLRQANAQAEQDNDRRRQLQTSLALLSVDASQVDYLRDRLLEAEPSEVPVIRDFLAPYKDQLLETLWASVEAPEKGKEPQRLRAAAALAKYDPEITKWAKAQEAVGNDLVRVPAVHLGVWLDALRDVRTNLLPQLSLIFRDSKRRETERSLATDILADYAADQPQLLADLLMEADEKQFAVIFAKLQQQAERGIFVLTGEIDKKLTPDVPSADPERERLAKRQANAAVALLRLNHADKTWLVFRHSQDPRARSYLIHRLYPFGVAPGAIIRRLDEEPDVSIRRALVLSLGEFGEEELSTDTRKALLPRLQIIYSDDADPGLHAAVEWLLRQWKQGAWIKRINDEWARNETERQQRLAGIQQRITKEKEKAPPQWYVNREGQTMVVFAGPIEFLMGSPPTDSAGDPREAQHKQLINRTFALATKTVTLEQFRVFKPGYLVGEVEQWVPSENCPVVMTNWFRAAEYCNWLSKREGLPQSEWCYEPFVDTNALPALAASSVGLLAGPPVPLPAISALVPDRAEPKYGPGMRLAPNYLHRIGYRLPTQAEMEFATRAGSVTCRYFGETEELMPHYVWYRKNTNERLSPVGGKKPNDFGLFDMLGNVYCWCQENDRHLQKCKDRGVMEDREDYDPITIDVSRVTYGGSYDESPMWLRAGGRNHTSPLNGGGDLGFRLARTLPLGQSPALPPTHKEARK